MRFPCVFFALLALTLAAPLAQAAGEGADIDQASQQVLMDSSKDAHNDLKDQMADVDRKNREKKALRDASSRLKPKHQNDNLLPKHDEANSRLMPKHHAESHLMPKHHDADNRLMPKHDNDRLKPKTGGLGARNGQLPVAGEGIRRDALDDKKKQLEDKKDGLGEQSQQVSHKIEVYQERRDKMEKTLSHVLQKSQDTSSSLTNNLK